MEKNVKKSWPEIVFGSSDPAASKAIQRAIKDRQLRKIAPRLYTSNHQDTPEEIIARHRYYILGKLFPTAVISHRSALEGGFANDNSIVLTYKYTKNITLPGLLIRLIKGADAMSGDTEFLHGLFIASRARAFLENLQVSRGRISIPKTLDKKELEERLDKLARVYGVEELNQLRDQAKILSKKLNLENEFFKFEKMIGAILGTHDEKVLQTDVAKARAKGLAFDPHRLELFSTLAAKLNATVLAQRPDKLTTNKARQNFAFFEAYFSNFIEGTEFEIEQAEKIIFEGKIIPNRSDDAHDILGTYKIVSSQAEMNKRPDDVDQLIKLLKHRHAVLMEARTSKNPGQFKEIVNRAGNTVFVKPDEVVGTLHQGFELYQRLEPGLARAIYMMFLISEIHPFLDGNGRVARIMMNAELTASEQCKIIIPTVYREDYLLALRKMSRQNEPAPYIRMLDRAQKFSSSFIYDDYQTVLTGFSVANAFQRADEAKLKFPEK